jgi:hypothetical protein
VTKAKEASILGKEGTIADLESRLSELNDKAAGLESAIGQSQPSSWSLSAVGIPIAALAAPCCDYSHGISDMWPNVNQSLAAFIRTCGHQNLHVLTLRTATQA